MKILHFTLGPVQGFVAQARRTRDLHAGSFLLSYLAGQAMYKIKERGGRIIFPEVHNDPLLQAIEKYAETNAEVKGPSIGTLPNRFKAEVLDDFNPVECEQAVKEAWQKIAAVVWKKYVEKVANQGRGVKQIWRRQIDNFWEMSWVVGEEDNLLDRRKNWRTHIPTTEPGDKCTIMANLQELSGYERIKEKRKQEWFWQSLTNQVKSLDIRKGERLCAISLVKRLFPSVSLQTIGWKLSVNYPSTAYLSAVRWLADTIEKYPVQVARFSEFVSTLPSSFQTKIYTLNCIDMLSQTKDVKMAALNSECFYENSLFNDNIWEADTAELRKTIYNKLREVTPEKPSPFYAVLLMDGDQLGVLLRKLDSASISRALGNFSAEVENIVIKHNGVTVYAGGDDVLALLPLEDALGAAIELQCEYKNAFQNELGCKATLSGAIVYAQYNIPLKTILTHAHKLLDDVAKDQTGRDSLAISVWKGSGLGLTWAAPWDSIVDGQNNLIEQLVNRFLQNGTEQAQFNSSFFYNLRKRFDILTEKEFKFGLNAEIDLLTAEYLKNRERKMTVTVADAKQNIELLLKICHRSWRENGILHSQEGPLTVDGALLVRFLASKGVRV